MASPTGSKEQLPTWIVLWNVITGLVCTWDASFILLRPHTLPGGKYHWFWKPYSLYIEVDRRYQDMEDEFVRAVSIMNAIEVVINIAVIYLHMAGSRRAVPLAFTVSTMTWWKTVLYMLQYRRARSLWVRLLQYLDVVGGGRYHAHNDWFRQLFVLWLPNAVWLVAPLAVMVALWPRLGGGGGGGGGGPVLSGGGGGGVRQQKTRRD